MAVTGEEPPVVGGNMKNALVADQVMESDAKTGDYILSQSNNDPSEWTEHIARQLRIDDDETHYSGELHTTLLMLVTETDKMFRNPPLPQTPELCRPLANAVTKSLSPRVVYDMLLIGPSEWRRKKVPADTPVSGLAPKLQVILESALAGELSRLYTQWTEWDVREPEEAARGSD
jgi:hypothetical protein